MARYIIANPKVAKFLNLERDRNTVADGNYLLWQADMLAFGPLTQLSETLQQIGGIALLAHEAREEQDGTVTRPLPVATDPRFVMEEQQPANEPETPAEAAEVTEGAGESQSESDTNENNESNGEGEGTGESETQAQAGAEAETPDNEPEGETPNDNTESETINAGDVGSVEVLVDFTGESENNENTEE